MPDIGDEDRRPVVRESQRGANAMRRTLREYYQGRLAKDHAAPIVVYDTSGPYTDPDAAIDIRRGVRPQFFDHQHTLLELLQLSS